MRTFVRAVPGLLLLAGCGSGAGTNNPEVQSQPTYDPTAMTTAAFAEYDRDKNGSLEGAELDACPALKGALGGIDTNKDGKISTAELKARFEGYKAANAGSVSVAVSLTLDGAPLADATVQFVPEAFMGGAVQEATGTTAADGTIASFTSGGKTYAGLQPGLYKVKVTRGAGKDLPARYNTQTSLGAEVFGGRGTKPISFALSSR